MTTDDRPRQRWRIATPALFIVTALALYLPWIDTSYSFDDFTVVYDDPSPAILGTFYKPGAGFHPAGWYRPIEHGFLALCQHLWGRNTVPVHLTQVALHAVLAWFVALSMARMNCPPPWAFMGGAFVLLTQFGTTAVLNNDTLSTVLVTLLLTIFVYTLHRWLSSGQADGTWRGGLAKPAWCIAIYALALLTKEAAVSVLALAAVVIAWDLLAGRRNARKVAAAAVMYLSLVAMTALYLPLRAAMQVTSAQGTGGTYALRVGGNVVRNLGQLLSACWQPASTVRVFWAIQERNPLLLAVAAGGAVALMGLTTAGIIRGGRWRLGLALATLSLASLVPMILLAHVSELYCYGAMPYCGALVGLGFGGLLARARSRPGRLLAGAAAVVLAAAMILAARDKAAMIHECGRRADDQMRQLAGICRRLPVGGQLLLASSSAGPAEYSTYSARDFHVLGIVDFERVLRHDTGRNDISVRHAELDKIDPGALPRDAVAVRWTAGRVVPIRPGDTPAK